ncbi:MAG: ATP-binding cassette domain-containing protein [Mitsuaria chitosanitabida]|uniref:ATP-binding cassette domain-containing protein n=1 Tax=Roseateles chitosanitabidus TaxID=65048 RepID=UPI001B0ABF6F|nr:ATP-binding cassette domain-containing protein [Roseateles chitosanitabidus]MBO9685484.1 ATP-binding cassette domain-containing protein [Roseateles chitosanitabidus]
MISVTEIDVLHDWQDSQPAALPEPDRAVAPARRGSHREADAETLDASPADAPPAGAPAVTTARSSLSPRGGQGVSLEGLGKSFGERQVLRDLDLRVGAGEFVAVIGRSGCGKSTLLRLLAGLDAPSAGTLEAGEASDTRFMFQDARLLPWARVVDNVALGLAAEDARDRALEALAQVGLADRANEWPARLSGGQRQRVALARALVHAPKLLLLDEPLGALDALTRIDMQRLIERVWTRHGFTALLVTHDVAEAVALADRVLLIEEGGLALDLRIDLPRPRRRDAVFAALEQHLLDRVLSTPDRDERAPPFERDRLPVAVPAPRLRWAV